MIDAKKSLLSLAGATLFVFAGTVFAGEEVEDGATLYGDMQVVTQDMLDHAYGDANNFLHTNGNYDQTRYHPSAQINLETGGKLKLAWTFKTKVKESM